MKANIFDVQRFSIHDGPGIRTTVFFKGCNLNCFWCHNPESISSTPNVMLDESKCIGCKMCIEICRNNVHQIKDDKHIVSRNDCTYCGECEDKCYAGAITKVGEQTSYDDIISLIARDENFYINSNGGITFSGGEPLLQAEAVKELLQRCKDKGYHTTVDTAGNVSWEEFEKILDNTDLFLYDIKCIDSATHKSATGKDNKLILENFDKLIASGKDVWIRVPIIPGVNDNAQEITRISELLKGKKVSRIELLPFHKLGSGKYKNLSKEYTASNLNTPDKRKMQMLADIIRKDNCNVFIG